jgi:DNA-binding PadR family transcriptional regulator
MNAIRILRPPVFHILLALAARKRHGLGIAKAVDEATEGAVQLGPGTLYRSLKEMLRDGLVAETSPPSSEADPRRRYYRITDAGREAARAEAARLARVVDVAREALAVPEGL